MDNPNPIYYKDLITPDDSIERLIDQLTELDAKYQSMQDTIKASAAEAAKSLHGVSGATGEQRQVIEQTANQAEELAQSMRNVREAQGAVRKELETAKQVQKEYNQLTKLQTELTRAQEGSYNQLSAQYRINKIRLNEMSAAEREGTEAGRKLETETRKLYEEMSRLQKATGKYTLEVGHYENALKALPGPMGQVVVSVQNISKRFTETKEAASGLAGSLGMSAGGMMAAIAGVAAGVGAAVGAFKLWTDSLHTTQAVGDAFDYNVAEWNATWVVFQKSVSTFDFSNFIQRANDAAEAGRKLALVLDSALERGGSIAVQRAQAKEENEILLQRLRNTQLSNEERKKAGEDYLKAMEPIYQQEADLAKEVEEARLEYLFAVVNTEKFATSEERDAARDQLGIFLQQYNLNAEKIENANNYLSALKDLEAAEKGYANSTGAAQDVWMRKVEQFRGIIAETSDEVKEYSNVVKRWALSSNQELTDYYNAVVNTANAANAFSAENRRIMAIINNLGKDGGGGSGHRGKSVASWSLQSDQSFQQQRLSLLKQYQEGEIVTRVEYERRVSELEIKTLQERLSRLKVNSSERLKIETQLREKEVALAEKIAAEEKRAADKRIADEQKAAADANRKTLEKMRAERDGIQLEMDGLEKDTEAWWFRRLDLIEKEWDIALEENRQKSEELRQDESLINAKYDKMLLDEYKKFGADAVKSVKNGADEAKKEYGDLWDVLGISIGGEQRKAVDTILASVKDSIGGIIDSWREVAKSAVDAADAQVESAQRVLDAEREAAANGYANSVKRAEKELALAKKNRQQALKEDQKAQQAQLTIDSITQASSLVTASANIWSSLSGVPIVGPALAVAALALMWGSFAASKIKAAQVTKETYGEGTVELLEGGSHASGNDIYLGQTKDGKERRAEGGEFFAVINKRNSRRYRSVIPDVINSLNDGTFADKYMSAGAQMAGYSINISGGADLSKIETGVDAIRKQGEIRRTTEGGMLVTRYKNLTRRERYES